MIVTSSPWDALAAPFAPTDLQWRVVKLSPDKLSAQVRPQLLLTSIKARLDAVLGVDGWSYSFYGLGERGLSCTLCVGEVRGKEVRRSAVAAYNAFETLEATAEDALVAAAHAFGMKPLLLLEELPWVDYDAEAGHILYDPDLEATVLEAPNLESPSPEAQAPKTPAPEASDGAGAPPAPANPLDVGESFSAEPPPATDMPAKSAGQQAIDKLVDRLKGEGRGLEAAKLLNAYGGYGSDPQTARELYARLRELLLGGAAP